MALSREEIAARYGAALFGYAQDNDALDTVYNEMVELKKAAEANPQIISVLSDPILSSKDKKDLLTAIEKDFSDEVQNFLNLILLIALSYFMIMKRRSHLALQLRLLS